jgi:DNA replication protein DnaC
MGLILGFQAIFIYKFVFFLIKSLNTLICKVYSDEKIILLGYMGYGKSTIAVALSKKVSDSICRFG